VVPGFPGEQGTEAVRLRRLAIVGTSESSSLSLKTFTEWLDEATLSPDLGLRPVPDPRPVPTLLVLSRVSSLRVPYPSSLLLFGTVAVAILRRFFDSFSFADAADSDSSDRAQDDRDPRLIDFFSEAAHRPQARGPSPSRTGGGGSASLWPGNPLAVTASGGRAATKGIRFKVKRF